MGVSMRLWEIDALRGMAILMMIMYHPVFDLGFLAIIPFSALYGFWRVFAFITALARWSPSQLGYILARGSLYSASSILLVFR